MVPTASSGNFTLFLFLLLLLFFFCLYFVTLTLQCSSFFLLNNSFDDDDDNNNYNNYNEKSAQRVTNTVCWLLCGAAKNFAPQQTPSWGRSTPLISPLMPVPQNYSSMPVKVTSSVRHVQALHQESQQF